jgi:hypothetical protein
MQTLLSIRDKLALDSLKINGVSTAERGFRTNTCFCDRRINTAGNHMRVEDIAIATTNVYQDITLWVARIHDSEPLYS